MVVQSSLVCLTVRPLNLYLPGGFFPLPQFIVNMNSLTSHLYCFDLIKDLSQSAENISLTGQICKLKQNNNKQKKTKCYIFARIITLRDLNNTGLVTLIIASFKSLVFPYKKLMTEYYKQVRNNDDHKMWSCNAALDIASLTEKLNRA